MIETPILVHNVTRSFGGPPVLKDLNLSVKAGSIYGFLGRNGSGKTTTIRMLAGLIKPAMGEVRVMGLDPFTLTAAKRQGLGYMSEKAGIPFYTKIGGVLELGRAFYPTWDTSLVDALLAKYGLSQKNWFRTLSQGQQRLFSFIMAIAPRPKVLLLDEPAANLDVVARREILDDILELIRERECTVLFSTHILSDVERVADEIGILAQGHLRVSESLDSLKDSIRQVRFFDFRNGMPEGDITENYRIVRGKGEITLTLRINADLTPETLAQRWSCQQETRVLNLEDIFIELSRN
ncbi:MAG TPA: ABC transporter ATP-binding protein [Candidatus Methylacidiphilales bacterium]|nr:ABC transporter ATP-binding protein [Candidatus Methylacidiphilales bacterium]